MTKYSAFGTALLMDGSLIAQVSNISGPGLAADTTDVTTHDSLDAWEEVTVTVLRSGEITLDIVYDPTIHATLLTVMKDKLVKTFELQFPDAAYTSYTMDGNITGFEPSAPVDGALTASVTIKITGVPDLSTTYSP